MPRYIVYCEDSGGNKQPVYVVDGSGNKRIVYVTIQESRKIYSLWKETEDWAGIPTPTVNCMQVIRDSDSTTTEIGWDVDGYVDVAAISTFCSGTTGRVNIWYDQAPGAFHLTPPGTAPIIYESGALKLDPWGLLKIAINNSYLSNTDTTAATAATVSRFVRGAFPATCEIVGNESGRMSFQKASSKYWMVGTTVLYSVRDGAVGCESLLGVFQSGAGEMYLDDLYSGTTGSVGTFTPNLGIRAGGISTDSNTICDLQTVCSWPEDKSAEMQDMIDTMRLRFPIADLSEDFAASLTSYKWSVPAGEGSDWSITGGALAIDCNLKTIGWEIKDSAPVFDHSDNWEVTFTVSNISFRASDLVLMGFGTGSTEMKYGVRIFRTGGNDRFDYYGDSTTSLANESITPAGSYTIKIVRNSTNLLIYRDSTLKLTTTVTTVLVDDLRFSVRAVDSSGTMTIDLDDITITEP